MVSVECEQVQRTITTVALVLCGPVWSAAQVNEIRGLVVDSSGQPVTLSSVTIARAGSDPSATQTGRRKQEASIAS